MLQGEHYHLSVQLKHNNSSLQILLLIPVAAAAVGVLLLLGAVVLFTIVTNICNQHLLNFTRQLKCHHTCDTCQIS